VLDPVVALAQNKRLDRQADLHRELQQPRPETPGMQRGRKDSATPWAKSFAEAINATGRHRVHAWRMVSDARPD
jgi:hypothetical protein